jgi:hypothetical protein
MIDDKFDELGAATGRNFPVRESVIRDPLPTAFGMLPRPFHKDRHEALKHGAHLTGQIVAVLVGTRIVHVGGLAQSLKIFWSEASLGLRRGVVVGKIGMATSHLAVER